MLSCLYLINDIAVSILFISIFRKKADTYFLLFSCNTLILYPLASTYSLLIQLTCAYVLHLFLILDQAYLLTY